MMSAIAHGYALSASALERADFYAAKKDWRGMGDHLHDHEIPEDFPWTGYAIGILAIWLGDQGVELPRDIDPTFSSLWGEISPVLCVQASKVQSLRDSLATLNPTGDELAAYWRKFARDNSPEAPTFMLEAWRWLNIVISHVQGEDWLLIVVA
jgi:hypothetical protein